MKRKEIIFRRTGKTLEGRQNGVLFFIFEDRERAGTCKPAHTVSTHDTKGQGRTICTAGHDFFHLDAAKDFCQKIATGEINVADLRMKYEAENMAKERAAIKAATEKAKQFRARLEAVGIS